MDFKKLAEKYYDFHTSPLVKIERAPKKFFLVSPDNHTEKIGSYQDCLGKALRYVKVDRRCARSKGMWLQDVALCKVTKLVGGVLKNFGFQDKTGIYLLPEETLFLVEQNKLELFHNDTPLSISEAYSLVIRSITLEKYVVYRKLVEQGFKLSNKEAIRKFYSIWEEETGSESSRDNKRKLTNSDDIPIPNKVQKQTDENEESQIRQNDETIKNDDFQEIFERLGERRPTHIIPCESSRHPDYFGFSPTSSFMHNHEFNLYIREKFNSTNLSYFEHIHNIFALSSKGNISFSRYPTVDISLIKQNYSVIN